MIISERCPVCGEISDSLVKRFADHPGQFVRRSIEDQYPAWTSASGCCERCFVSRDLPRSSSRLVRRHGPFAVLPIPLRADADPRFSGRGVTIAFLDSGFFPHPELRGGENRILAMVDVTSDKCGAAYFRTPQPESWHGTMSSVIASGSGSLSDSFYRGIARDAPVVCVKVLNRKTGRISEREIAQGIRWVIDNRARYNIRILNISVGGDSPKPLNKSKVDQLVEEASENGILTVIAVGNTPGNPILPPASAPSGLAVGGYDDHDQTERTAWSMYPTTWGITKDGHRKPDLLGPAGGLAGPLLPRTDQAAEATLLFRVLSSSKSGGVRLLWKYRALLREKAGRVTEKQIEAFVRQRITDSKYVSRYHKRMEGTSVAAAVVSSVAAQMLEANPTLGISDLRSILTESAVPMPNVAPEQQGSGTLNPREAVARALRSRHTVWSPGVERRANHLVFLFDGEEVDTVHLAGDFNNWDPGRTCFQELEDHRWSCMIPLPPDRSDQYKLVINGDRWIHDPNNDRKISDGFGGWNSRFPAESD